MMMEVQRTAPIAVQAHSSNVRRVDDASEATVSRIDQGVPTLKGFSRLVGRAGKELGTLRRSAIGLFGDKTPVPRSVDAGSIEPGSTAADRQMEPAVRVETAVDRRSIAYGLSIDTTRALKQSTDLSISAAEMPSAAETKLSRDEKEKTFKPLVDALRVRQDPRSGLLADRISSMSNTSTIRAVDLNHSLVQLGQLIGEQTDQHVGVYQVAARVLVCISDAVREGRSLRDIWPTVERLVVREADSYLKEARYWDIRQIEKVIRGNHCDFDVLNAHFCAEGYASIADVVSRDGKKRIRTLSFARQQSTRFFAFEGDEELAGKSTMICQKFLPPRALEWNEIKSERKALKAGDSRALRIGRENIKALPTSVYLDPEGGLKAPAIQARLNAYMKPASEAALGAAGVLVMGTLPFIGVSWFIGMPLLNARERSMARPVPTELTGPLARALVRSGQSDSESVPSRRGSSELLLQPAMTMKSTARSRVEPFGSMA